ncbi:MAG TPA: hypothetical protein VLI55_08595, partial [Bryobacteraceae bacterium]|nr:hypothetical protein [Bryobacteraceae bacterium]
MRFEFATASRIIFGFGVRRQLPGLVREFGTRALVITGASADRAAPLIAALEALGIRCSRFSIPRE